MHLQLRSATTLSPADLGKLLDVVAGAKFNIIAAGGSDVEHGGEFAFAVEDGEEEQVLALLKGKRYAARIVEVEYCLVDDRPGQLAACVQGKVREQAASGKKIKDLAIGPRPNGQVLVQLYFE